MLLCVHMLCCLFSCVVFVLDVRGGRALWLCIRLLCTVQRHPSQANRPSDITRWGQRIRRACIQFPIPPSPEDRKALLGYDFPTGLAAVFHFLQGTLPEIVAETKDEYGRAL